MRIVLILALLILLALGVFMWGHEGTPQTTVGPAPERAVATAPTPSPPVPARPIPKKKPAPGPVDAGVGRDVVADAAPVVDAEMDESGLYHFSLGVHRVQLKGDGAAVLSAEIVISTASATARDHTRRLRNKLVGMYYFLVSRRVAASALADDGQSRLEGDLLRRFGNVIRGGPLSSVELKDYEVIEDDSDSTGKR